MRFPLLSATLQPGADNVRSLLASTVPGTRISPTLRHPLLPPQAAEPVKGAREIRRRSAITVSDLRRRQLLHRLNLAVHGQKVTEVRRTGWQLEKNGCRRC